MPRPKIATAEFWTRRIDAVTDNIGRYLRSGLQAVGLAGAGGVAEKLNANWVTLVQAFFGGVLLSLITTFGKPPVPAGGDPEVDAPADPDRGDIGIMDLVVIAILVLAVVIAIQVT